MKNRRRTAIQAGGILTALAFLGIAACSSDSPSKRELKKIATSAAVQERRQEAEKVLRDRAREIETRMPWLKPLNVVTHDQCRDTRGNTHLFDPNPPKKMSMMCTMSSHVLFSVDRPPRDVVEDILHGEVTEWTDSSVNDVRTYYGDDSGLQLSDDYIPSLASSSEEGIHEELRWDTGSEKISVNFPRDALWDRFAYRYPEKPIAQLRQQSGTIFMWSLYAKAYYTVS